MDDATLASLRLALEASPSNLELLRVVLRAYLERGEPKAGRDLLAAREIATLADDDRLLAARICLAADDPERVLELTENGGPAALLVRARALLQLDRTAEGLLAYDAAVAANPALEQSDLRARLTSHVRVFRGKPEQGDRPRLKVIDRGSSADERALDDLLVPETERIDFDKVGGLADIKKQIRKRIILPFQKPSLFQRFRKRIGGGILLYGPPGCGKTMLARATAGECAATFLNIAISDILDMYVGESEAKLHAIFEKARTSTPAVIFFDEVEALGGKRQFSRDATTAKLVSQFLAEMDGFAQNNQGVLILGATNVPWAVDSAFRRPGRFDRSLFVPPPDRVARERILEIHLSDRPVDGKPDLARIAKKTSGFSGADLKHLIETAADEAIEQSIADGDERPISERHLDAALKEVKPTTLEWLTTARNHARYANEGGQYDEVLAFLNEHGKG